MKIIFVTLLLALAANGTHLPMTRASILEAIRELSKELKAHVKEQTVKLANIQEEFLVYASQSNENVQADFNRTIADSLEVLGNLYKWADVLGVPINKRCPRATYEREIQKLKVSWSNVHFECSEKEYLNGTHLSAEAIQGIEGRNKVADDYVNRALDCGNNLLCLNNLFKEVTQGLPGTKDEVIDVALANVAETVEVETRIFLCASESVKQMALNIGDVLRGATDCLRNKPATVRQLEALNGWFKLL